MAPPAPPRRSTIQMPPLPATVRKRPVTANNMTMAPPFLTEVEYAVLPASVQRKYFSSAERLEIAERSARRPQTSRSPSHSSTRAESRGRRRLRKTHAPNQDPGISQIEAQWFLSLPDKIIKTCLSREEAVLLSGRCGALLVESDGTSSAFDKPSEQDLSPLPAMKKRISVQEDSVIDQSLFENEHTGDEFLEEPEIILRPGRPARREFHRRSSSHRTLSLTNTLPRLSTSSAPPLPSPVLSLSQRTRRLRANTNIVFPRYGGGGTHAETKYYQDPEARMKLRLYLSSPRKFDEVIEYGFPSTSQVERTPESSPSECYKWQASHDVQTFLRDDCMSFLDNNDNEEDSDDESSIGDAETPVTPLDDDDVFGINTKAPSSNLGSPDSTGSPSLDPQLRKLQNSHAQAFPGSREMTLRMTLTRPELRADEGALYGWQDRVRNDPLALEELPPASDDTTGMRGPFAIQASREGGLVKRIIHKVKEKAKQ